MKKYIAIAWLVACGAAHALECPPGTAEIPALPDYTHEPYCLMTDLARKPRIEVEEYINYISTADARALCKSAFKGGDLPENRLWQAAVRQMEFVPANWSSGVAGVGRLLPDLELNGRTFLHMGDVLWKRVIGQIPWGIAPGDASEIKEGAGGDMLVAGMWGDFKNHFGPQKRYGSYAPSQKLGRHTQPVGNAIARGGDGDEGEQGAFAAALNHDDSPASDFGFMCACKLSICGR